MKSTYHNVLVAPVAYQVILGPGTGQFLELDPRRLHARANSLGLCFCAHVDLRKARERELAALDEKWTSNGIAEPYARSETVSKNRGGKGTTSVTTAYPEEAGKLKGNKKKKNFLSLLPLLVVSFLAFCVFSFVSFSCSFFAFFSFLHFIFFFFVSFSLIDLRLSCVCVAIGTTYNIYVVVVYLGWQAVKPVFPGASSETYAPGWTWRIHRRHLVGAGIASRDLNCVYHFWLFVFFPWGIPQLQGDWSLSCDHVLDYAS